MVEGVKQWYWHLIKRYGDITFLRKYWSKGSLCSDDKHDPWKAKQETDQKRVWYLLLKKNRKEKKKKEKNGFYSEGVGGAEIYEAKTEMTGF